MSSFFTFSLEINLLNWKVLIAISLTRRWKMLNSFFVSFFVCFLSWAYFFSSVIQLFFQWKWYKILFLISHIYFINDLFMKVKNVDLNAHLYISNINQSCLLLNIFIFQLFFCSTFSPSKFENYWLGEHECDSKVSKLMKGKHNVNNVVSLFFVPNTRVDFRYWQINILLMDQCTSDQELEIITNSRFNHKLFQMPITFDSELKLWTVKYFSTRLVQLLRNFFNFFTLHNSLSTFNLIYWNAKLGKTKYWFNPKWDSISCITICRSCWQKECSKMIEK